MSDPTKTRLSKHFLLSDFMGTHSVYSKGLRNAPPIQFMQPGKRRIENGRALCENALEPLLAEHGPISISYGYISPDVSREIVTYMDPDKPSHHRWDLGAAADVCVHSWVNRDPDVDSADNSPVMLAHSIDQQGIPYSRLITYSESPYICIAVSADEVGRGIARKAFYENRYEGKARAKPEYRSYSSPKARSKAYAALCDCGLAHGWRGAEYPTYHGGGRRQFHHVRVSASTMLSDWLFDLQSIANGAKNMPNMQDANLLEMFYAVGDAYDEILLKTGAPRMSIIAGYVSHTNPYFDPANDWRSGRATFTLVPPEGMTCDDVRLSLIFGFESKITAFGHRDDALDITVEL